MQASSNVLTKFTLHPASTLAGNSPIVLAQSSSYTLNPTSLSTLRTQLLQSRTLAAERVIIKDSNKRELSNRQTEQNKILELLNQAKEEERKNKKREEDEKEQERIKQQGTVEKVLQLVQDNQIDTIDSSQPIASVSTLPPPISIQPFSGAMKIDTSSDSEDQISGQPKPPHRKKGLDKKKRKRDQVLDSDASGEDRRSTPELPSSEKHRKLSRTPLGSLPSSLTGQPSSPHPLQRSHIASPAGPSTLQSLRQKLQTASYQKHSIPTRQPYPGTASAFYIPSNSLVPSQPKSQINPSTAKRQSEVSEEFDKVKVGTQVAFGTWFTWTEGYLRPFTEDDIAFLARKADNTSALAVPSLGAHYLDVWEAEDSHPSASHQPVHYSSALEPPPLPRLRPENLTEDAMGMESIFVGPLTERLVSALVFEGSFPFEDSSSNPNGVKFEKLQDEDSEELDNVDLEERIRKELRFIGVLEEDVSWSNRSDDPITSSLRQCQALLQSQVTLNNTRKDILTGIVKDRMAYQDYETTLEAQEKIIEGGWTKRSKAPVVKRKSNRDGKEKRATGDRGDGRFGSNVLFDANGEIMKPPISIALEEAMLKRERLVGCFKPFFNDPEDQGRFFGIPETSVYSGVEGGGHHLTVRALEKE